MIPFLFGSLQSSGASTSDYELIETQTVGAGGAATVVLGSGGTIPQTYKHLQIRGIVRNSYTAANDWRMMYGRFNGDTAANYSTHALYGDGATAYSSGTANTTYCGIADSVTNGSTASIFTAFVLDILDYTNTNKYKTTRALSGLDLNGAGFFGIVRVSSGAWRNTAAITSITLLDPTYNFVQNSTVSLYGMK